MDQLVSLFILSILPLLLFSSSLQPLSCLSCLSSACFSSFFILFFYFAWLHISQHSTFIHSFIHSLISVCFFFFFFGLYYPSPPPSRYSRVPATRPFLNSLPPGQTFLFGRTFLRLLSFFSSSTHTIRGHALASDQRSALFVSKF